MKRNPMTLHASQTILLAVVLGLAGSGCADLKSDLPSPSDPGVQVHKEGWASPSSPDFHGNTIRAANWDMRSCKTCHGAAYDGGTVQVSCRTCHTGAAGPEECTTCHGGVNPAPPRDLNGNTARSSRGVGAHQFHLNSSALALAINCSECHTVPSAVYVPGHIDGDNRAEVQFNGTLALTVTNEPSTTDYDASLPLYAPAPVHSPTQLSCSDTYCHGNFKNGNNFSPVWNDTTGTQAACGTCHGDLTKTTPADRALPKTSANGGTHPSVTACSACHGDVVDANLNIIDSTKHVNGKLNVFGSERDY
jgi:predicted CxxxxCH...CXXCH cytochrome family protein